MKTSAVTVRGLTFSAMFAALLVVLSFVTIYTGFSPVPITLQNFAVMLAGAVLGARYGLISVGTVVVLTALGFPLLHGAGGPGLIFGPTGGFIWAYPLAAFFIGYFVNRIKGHGIFSFLLLFIVMLAFGSLLLYVPGVPWLAYSAKISLGKAMVLGCYPYLPGDAIKALAAALIVLPVRKLFPASRLM
ncbi:biotin transporter BioY [Paenibacillus sp. J2TS4]|uniref:biotin transporter BioY n=1 Tax=Paenibacillus sp. J2TS4 TaxID=2807194 RepID=UPI001B116787|nr:biotin transporter BioY [Paenibacillus sp. J2TS4]GIP31316.1 biotin transporter BioY [Paenibacillus sp. J2TS4]